MKVHPLPIRRPAHWYLVERDGKLFVTNELGGASALFHGTHEDCLYVWNKLQSAKQRQESHRDSVMTGILTGIIGASLVLMACAQLPGSW